jgi:hypothetical protein
LFYNNKIHGSFVNKAEKFWLRKCGALGNIGRDDDVVVVVVDDNDDVVVVVVDDDNYNMILTLNIVCG